MVPICEAIVGTNGAISFSETNHKLVFLEGYNKLKIIPLLHQNLLRLKSHEKNDYLFATQVKDKFLALSARDENVT